MVPFGGMLKRPRSEYGHEMHNYLVQDDDITGARALQDTKSIGSAYDRYLQNRQLSSDTCVGVGVGSGRPVGGAVTDPSLTGRSSFDLLTNEQNISVAHFPVDAMPIRETAHLPPDATNTLYIEGLPPDSTRREVAHIFRPFVGYKEVRLVSKDSKLHGGNPLILCFVDFINPACAATAMSALQGYKIDEQNPDLNYLRLQFSWSPGPRSGHGSRSKR